MIFEKIKKYFNKKAVSPAKEVENKVDNYSSYGNTTVLNTGIVKNNYITAAGGGYYANSIITTGIISNISYSNRIVYNFGPNSQKLFFQIHGETIPRGEKFNEFGEYHIIEQPIDKHATRLFHFKVWNKINDHVKDYGLIYVEDSGMFLVFNTLESKNSFIEWIDDYKNKFFQDIDMDAVSIPNLPEGNLTGVFLRGLFSEKMPPDNLDSWIKVVKNCSSPVYKTPDGWFFINPTDAVICKML